MCIVISSCHILSSSSFSLNSCTVDHHLLCYSKKESLHSNLLGARCTSSCPHIIFTYIHVCINSHFVIIFEWWIPLHERNVNESWHSTITITCQIFDILRYSSNNWNSFIVYFAFYFDSSLKKIVCKRLVCYLFFSPHIFFSNCATIY